MSSPATGRNFPRVSFYTVKNLRVGRLIIRPQDEKSPNPVNKRLNPLAHENLSPVLTMLGYVSCCRIRRRRRRGVYRRRDRVDLAGVV